MNRHRFDPISFVFGALFVAIAAAIALPETPWQFVFGGISFGWILPAALILVGVALLAPAFRGTGRSAGDDENRS